MDKKVIKKECAVGFKCWFEDKPNNIWFEQGRSEQGYVFKDEEAFDKKSKCVCYIPEYDSYWEEVEECKTEQDFIALSEEICNGYAVGYNYYTFVDEVCCSIVPLAYTLFHDVDWQHPETLLMEWGYETDVATLLYNVSGDDDMEFLERIADLYDEERDGSDWEDLYHFYLKHKNQ